MDGGNPGLPKVVASWVGDLSNVLQHPLVRQGSEDSNVSKALQYRLVSQGLGSQFLSTDMTRGLFLTGDVSNASAFDMSKVLQRLLVCQGSEEQRRVQGPPAPAGMPRLRGSLCCPRLSSTSWSR